MTFLCIFFIFTPVQSRVEDYDDGDDQDDDEDDDDDDEDHEDDDDDDDDDDADDDEGDARSQKFPFACLLACVRLCACLLLGTRNLSSLPAWLRETSSSRQPSSTQAR